jgi:hypothetical protein
MPRRSRDLWTTLTLRQHLFASYGRARRAGRSRPATTAFDYHLECELDALRTELVEGTYRPGPQVTVRSTRVPSSVPRRRPAALRLWRVQSVAFAVT